MPLLFSFCSLHTQVITTLLIYKSVAEFSYSLLPLINIPFNEWSSFMFGVCPSDAFKNTDFPNYA